MGTVLLVVGLVVGFVTGILVGRNNKKGVEALLVQAKAEIAKLQNK